MSDIDNAPQRDSHQQGPNGEATIRSEGLEPPAPRRAIPPRLYRVSDLAGYSGLSRQTIHNYTTMGLLKESRWTQGGHRLYDEDVFARLDHIVRLKHGRKRLQEIREVLDSAGATL